MSARYYVMCDGCGETALPSGKSIRFARLAPGWTNPKRGHDYCPECSAQRAAEEKERNPHGYF